MLINFVWRKSKEATMKKRWTLTTLGVLLVAFFTTAPVRGADVDQRIKALEDELTRLKSEQEQVKTQQIEMRKEAEAAAAALPDFSYRPGSGFRIEAADKSWSFRASMEAHFRMLFEHGLTEAGRETGGVMGRRFRPTFFYCVNDCLYEIETSIDMDGFGTGNAHNAQGTGLSSILQRGVVWFHLEKLNPWLPTVYTGMDGPAAISSYRQGSSSTGAQQEYDMLSRNNGFNTGRWGNGFGFNWADRDLSGIGVPGRVPLFNVVYATIGEGDDGRQSFRDQRSTSIYFNIEPFSQIKNKWIQGIGLEWGAWFCPNIANGTQRIFASDSACGELRVRDNGDGGRQDLFRADAGDGHSDGSGMTHFIMPGFAWTIGPYRFRATGGFQRYDGSNNNVRGNNFLLGHDLFIWSPKGFLTGSSSEPGSILLGTHFERTDLSCPTDACNNGTNPITGDPQFKRNRILLREWNIWYFLMNRMSIGATWAWFDAANVRVAQNTGTGSGGIQGSNNVSRNLGCTSSHQKSLETPGKGCDWVDFSITWRYQF
jgi:hypothetical protein